MTRRVFYVQCTKIYYLKCVRETYQENLNRSQTYSLRKSKIIAKFNPTCLIKNYYVCP